MGSGQEYERLEGWRGKIIKVESVDGKMRHGTLEDHDERCIIIVDSSTHRAKLLYKHAIVAIDEYVPTQSDRTRTREMRIG